MMSLNVNNTVCFYSVFTLVHCFSMVTRLIALPKLPSAFDQIIKIHRITKDIVMGPHFILWVWQAFSTGYHPKANGQVEKVKQDVKAKLQRVMHQNVSCWAFKG